MNILNLPKTELHRHLDCSMRFSTMIEVARKLSIKLPDSIEAQKDLFLLEKPLENLQIVLSKFQIAQSLLHSYEVLENLAFDTVEETAKENTKLIELRYSPTFIQNGHPNLRRELIHEAFLKGIDRAKQKHQIAVGLILIVQRTLPLSEISNIIDFAIDQKNTLVGIDLADNEDGYEAKLFAKDFQRAKNAGLHITVHAGEVPTDQGLQNIEDAIIHLGAERIGHGVQAIKSKQILKLLRENDITLEVCPTSNYLTQFVTQLKDHPLKKLYNEGIKLTINTDDPGIFNYTLTHELQTIQRELNISDKEIFEFQKNGFTASFIPRDQKSNFIKYFEET